eukprot:TRINITY_DN15000_c0_g1_i1.p1 TRINITY_DN15000_c0_g1~~TRINITY_DN15000_c0_g1_i1.p1  ORF type:complete len:556 (+),score=66.89 TRINITY_DN15000_c0_g1_i1:875-2542(+)
MSHRRFFRLALFAVAFLAAAVGSEADQGPEPAATPHATAAGAFDHNLEPDSKVSVEPLLRRIAVGEPLEGFLAVQWRPSSPFPTACLEIKIAAPPYALPQDASVCSFDATTRQADVSFKLLKDRKTPSTLQRDHLAKTLFVSVRGNEIVENYSFPIQFSTYTKDLNGLSKRSTIFVLGEQNSAKTRFVCTLFFAKQGNTSYCPAFTSVAGKVNAGTRSVNFYTLPDTNTVIADSPGIDGSNSHDFPLVEIYSGNYSNCELLLGPPHCRCCHKWLLTPRRPDEVLKKPTSFIFFVQQPDSAALPVLEKLLGFTNKDNVRVDVVIPALDSVGDSWDRPAIPETLKDFMSKLTALGGITSVTWVPTYPQLPPDAIVPNSFDKDHAALTLLNNHVESSRIDPDHYRKICIEGNMRMFGSPKPDVLLRAFLSGNIEVVAIHSLVVSAFMVVILIVVLFTEIVLRCVSCWERRQLGYAAAAGAINQAPQGAGQPNALVAQPPPAGSALCCSCCPERSAIRWLMSAWRYCTFVVGAIGYLVFLVQPPEFLIDFYCSNAVSQQ